MPIPIVIFPEFAETLNIMIAKRIMLYNNLSPYRMRLFSDKTVNIRIEDKTIFMNTVENPTTIGNNNKISNSTIANNLKGGETNKNRFYEKHPVICGFLISLVAGIVLLFSFWNQIIAFISQLKEALII